MPVTCLRKPLDGNYSTVTLILSWDAAFPLMSHVTRVQPLIVPINFLLSIFFIIFMRRYILLCTPLHRFMCLRTSVIMFAYVYRNLLRFCLSRRAYVSICMNILLLTPTYEAVPGYFCMLQTLPVLDQGEI